jgi:hypothetical protein
MIQIRKLVAVDTAWLGARFIVAEYALGIVLPLALGSLSLRGPFGWPTLMGVWLVGIAANYIPMLLYAVSLARAGTAKAEAQPEMANVKRYSLQQAMLLVPLLVCIVALVQERQPHR